MKSKLIQIPYTIGIIKPHVVLQPDKLAQVHELLEKNHFEVFESKRKILTQEEVLNLFFQYRNQTFFSDIKEHMMTAESEVLLLINSHDTVQADPNDENSEVIKLEPAVDRWKKLIGLMNPEEATAEDPECLRAIYGVDIIKNAFHGADNNTAANKERDIFLFPIPERPPEFEYIRTKIPMEMILKFLYPPNLEHANSTGRLDLLALYGPIVNHHSVDYCFCSKCQPVAKEQLQHAIAEKDHLAMKKKMGSTGGIN